uniref:GTP-binding protein n=1 Tax=Steinernema glaseri TaxID=37863 RepID=A0A1I8AE82_9BILA
MRREDVPGTEDSAPPVANRTLTKEPQTMSDRVHRSHSAARPSRHSIPTGDEARKVSLTLVVLGAEKLGPLLAVVVPWHGVAFCANYYPEVGKSALVSQFLWCYFPIDYHPTVEEFNWIEYDVSGNDTINYEGLLLEVIDTSGSRDFLAMRNLYESTGDAFVVVFSVDSQSSFKEAKAIISDIRARNGKDAPILLIANKMDLLESDKKSEWSNLDVDDYIHAEHLLFSSLSARDTSAVETTFGRLLERLRNRRCSGRPVLTKRRQSMPSKQVPIYANFVHLQTVEKNKDTRCSVM